MPSAGERSWNQDGYRLSQKDVEAYLDDLASRNATENTVANYRRSLSMFSEWLPEDRLVNEARVNDYQKNLLAKYTPRTVNMKLTAVNGLLRYLGLRQYQSTTNIKVDPIEIRPELTRNEYLRMLSAAKQNEDKRLYLLIKLFATTGITVQEVDNVTVEAVQEGKVVTYPGRVRHEVRIPPCVQEELLEYIHELGYRSGPHLFNERRAPVGANYHCYYDQAIVPVHGASSGKMHRPVFAPTVYGDPGEHQGQCGCDAPDDI